MGLFRRKPSAYLVFGLELGLGHNSFQFIQINLADYLLRWLNGISNGCSEAFSSAREPRRKRRCALSARRAAELADST